MSPDQALACCKTILPTLRLSHTLKPTLLALALARTHPTLAMDAFFVIAAPLPVEDTSSSTQEFDEIFADHERLSTSSSHSGCVIA
ncbi:hypothetical protein C8Q76DRAFT_802192 [Earliella scabrosa]|nr:hypothetical protein C8Q76DRAFT_802192 [Earliella scabrosa]